MRATRIRTTARGLDLTVQPTAPVVVLHGPNGAGKSTLLNSVVAAVTGTIMQGGEPVKAVQTVYRALAPGFGDVRMRVEFGGDHVDRTMRGKDGAGGKLSVSQRLLTTFAAHGLGDREATGAVIGRLGNPALFDVQAFLALGPTERQKRLLTLCAQLTPPWPASRVIGSISNHADLIADGDDDLAGKVAMAAWGADGMNPGATDEELFYVEDAETFYDALARYRAGAARRAADNAAEVERCQKAILRLDKDAAERIQAVHGTVEAVDAELARLGAELEQLNRDLGQAESAHARRQSIATESARLEALVARPVDELEVEHAAAADALAQARDELAALAEAEPPTFVPDPEIAELRAERALVAERIRALEERLAQARAEAASVQRAREALTAHAEGARCPVCLGAIDDDAFDRLDAAQAQHDAEVAAAEAALEGPRTELARLDVDIREIEQEDRERELAVARERGQREQRLRQLRHDTAPAGPLAAAIASAAAALEARRGAAERLAAIQAEAAGLPTLDLAALRTTIEGAAAQRDDATARRKAIAEADERRKTRLRAVADRDAADTRQRVLNLAIQAWDAVIADFAREAIAPLAETVNRVAPAGWTFEVDVEKAELRVARRGRPTVPLVALSDGEQGLLFPAVSAALARASGAGWRVILADRADGMQSMPAPGAPRGLFVRFVQGLVGACAADEIDQAFIATARLTPEERRALAAMKDVQVVDLGCEVEAVANAPAGADDEDGDESEAVARIRAAVEPLTPAGVRALYEQMGAVPDSSIPVARAQVPQVAAQLEIGALVVEQLAERLPRRGAEARAQPQASTGQEATT